MRICRSKLASKGLKNALSLKSGLIIGYQEQLLKHVPSSSAVSLLIKTIRYIQRAENGLFGNMRYLIIHFDVDKVLAKRKTQSILYYKLNAYSCEPNRFFGLYFLTFYHNERNLSQRLKVSYLCAREIEVLQII